MSTNKKVDLDQTVERKSAAMQRVLDYLKPNGKQAALCLVMSWMSTADIENMVGFWEESK